MSSVNENANKSFLRNDDSYLLVLTADPVSLSFLSAAKIAALVLSETWRFWSTDLTFSLTTDIPTVNFSVSPTLLSKDNTFADALAVSWCFSSNAFALFMASCPIAEPLASTFATTSCALLTYIFPLLDWLPESWNIKRFKVEKR